MNNTEMNLLEKLEKIIAINESLANENKVLKASLSEFSVDEDLISIGCNAIMGVTLESPTKEVVIDIKYGEDSTLGIEDVKLLLKSQQVRTMFAESIVYFVNESSYKKLNVKKKFDISEETLVKNISSMEVEELLKYFNLCTNKKLNTNLMHTVFYKIVAMNLEDKFGNMNYGKRKFLEEYFNMDIDMAGRLYLSLKNIIR